MKLILKFKKSRLKSGLMLFSILGFFVLFFISGCSKNSSSDANLPLKDLSIQPTYQEKNLTYQLSLIQQENYRLNKAIDNLTATINLLNRQKACVPMNWEGRDGIAFGSRYYCIWTDNVMPDILGANEVHEKCHVLVEKQFSHFCSRTDNNSTTYIFAK